MFLYEKIDVLRENGDLKEIPQYIEKNLSPNIELRPYQTGAFKNFITYYEGKMRQKPTQVLFHMATGSGKTVIMAGLMLYLYKMGYRNFLFFVNLSTIVEKTKTNFKDRTSSKYLFADDIVIDGERISIQEVTNFQYSDPDKINICFTSTQGLHTAMWSAKENSMTFDDFEDRKVVLLSDEAHHLNVDTKKKLTAREEKDYHSWEATVKRIFNKNKDNILLEFTATCDLENPAIKAEYENKIVFNYPLKNYYKDKYSKDIRTLRSTLPRMDRALQALVLSQYRLKVFQDYRLAIKPVILFKARIVADSEDFMKEFINTVQNLSGEKLEEIRQAAIQGEESVLINAFNYFDTKGITRNMLAQELRDDFGAPQCISANDEQKVEDFQLALNSLEDKNNPYRAIFAVDKLNEGWDVLNLFDIVRLYETRQSGGKMISPVTISEAQLIGRGARYCPFQIDSEQPKFQRKYDDDVTNSLRICEQMYYHCQNDHRYVTELHTALKEIGLVPERVEQKEYVLKNSFKKDLLYKNGYVFVNARKLVSRNTITGLNPTTRDKLYKFNDIPHSFNEDRIMEDSKFVEDRPAYGETATTHLTISKIAKINYAIVNKALMKFPVFKFNVLKKYYPNLKSTREFITDDAYLGSIRIDITSQRKELPVSILYQAVFNVVQEISEKISSIEETYVGTTRFKGVKFNKVFTNKTVNYTDPQGEGAGISQKDWNIRPQWKIDLSQEDWFVYTDNFGTPEEKAFVAYFKGYVNELRKKYDKVYLVRNEREFHLYSFDNGDRFEPDYVLFLQKEKARGYEQLQIFIEPKGTGFLEKDNWKEEFLLQMRQKSIPVTILRDDNHYKIWGFHFFNHDERMKEFGDDMKELLED